MRFPDGLANWTKEENRQERIIIFARPTKYLLPPFECQFSIVEQVFSWFRAVNCNMSKCIFYLIVIFLRVLHIKSLKTF